MTKEEAMERVKARFDKWALDNEDIKAIQTIIPELRENEGEKIMDDIMEAVENWFPYERVEEIRYYLNKQKEQKPIAESKRLANEVIEYLTKCGYSPVLKDDIKKEYFHIDIPRHEDDFWLSEEYKHCRIVLGEYYMEGNYGGDTYTLYVWREKKEQKPIKWDELTWEDINDLETIMNEVHSDFRNGIGEKSFGLEVLERFRYNKGDENLEAIAPKFKVGDEICSVDGQYEDTVLEVLSDGSYRLKNLGILSIPESEWRLVNAPVDGYELIDKQQSTEQKPAEYSNEEEYFDSELRAFLCNYDKEYDDDPAVSDVAKYFYELGKKQLQQEWSNSFEENIRILLHDKLTWHSEDGSMSSTVLIDNKTLKDIINGIWFYVGKEALKYPNKELNVAEWSEEDEGKLEQCIRIVSGWEVDYDIVKSPYSNFLKSLRPSWKPSEEQMKWLKDVIETVPMTCRQQVPLESLYVDLQKLL